MSRAVLGLAFATASFAAESAAAPETPPPSPASLEAGCAAGDQTACTALGYHLSSLRAFPPDVPRAFDLWRRACAAGALAACIPYAELLLTGHEPGDARRYVASVRAAERIRPDRSEGRRVLARACDGGQARACDILGIVLSGEKRKRDEACRLFARACAAGDPGGCIDQVRACRRTVPVSFASAGAKPGARVDFQAAAFAADRNGALVVERAGAGREVRVARVDRTGRVAWTAAVPAGAWGISGCSDGRTGWLADGRRLFQLDGTGVPRAVPVLAAATEPDRPSEQQPELVACLADGSVVAARAVLGNVTDDDFRQHLARHPGLLDQPEEFVFQKVELSVYPHNRPREIERARALARQLAAELQRGQDWSGAVKKAKEGWYSTNEMEKRFSPSEHPPPGAPPPELFQRAAGHIFGPVEQLESVQRGRFERRKGGFTIWRVVSRRPARAPTPDVALAKAHSTLRARLVELVIATPKGAVEQRRLPVITTSLIGGDGRLGPLVPLDGGGFALLGDNRQVWKGGRWSHDTPLLTAVGPRPVLDAVRDGARVAVLTDGRVRVFGLDGRLLDEAPRSRVAAGAFYPRRIGAAGPDGLLLASPNLGKVDVLALDERLAIRWVDTLPVDGDDFVGLSAAFADSGLWLLNARGTRITAYQGRQVADYELGATSSSPR